MKKNILILTGVALCILVIVLGALAIYKHNQRVQEVDRVEQFDNATPSQPLFEEKGDSPVIPDEELNIDVSAYDDIIREVVGDKYDTEE